ncbi:uncharacterized protein K441DRAFT_683043 [Cenococcum geophilum 1.58]|uniref:Uncharacterized protein n=1 Tax=Cenococcum geophilum 1.58 TaxID=794803 RepID=A0ACC8EKX2_9PEZI|nr:hypothetical protein K441DRAFT_683043 [Cenococcum geophilum 1.58]
MGFRPAVYSKIAGPRSATHILIRFESTSLWLCLMLVAELHLLCFYRLAIDFNGRRFLRSKLATLAKISTWQMVTIYFKLQASKVESRHSCGFRNYISPAGSLSRSKIYEIGHSPTCDSTINHKNNAVTRWQKNKDLLLRTPERLPEDRNQPAPTPHQLQRPPRDHSNLFLRQSYTKPASNPEFTQLTQISRRPNQSTITPSWDLLTTEAFCAPIFFPEFTQLTQISRRPNQSTITPSCNRRQIDSGNEVHHRRFGVRVSLPLPQATPSILTRLKNQNPSSSLVAPSPSTLNCTTQAPIRCTRPNLAFMIDNQ